MRKKSKTNPYILVGLGTLLTTAFLLASFLYGGSQSRSTSSVTQAPNDRLSEILVRPDSRAKGPSLAKVTVVEFLDPECESCRAMHPIVKRIAGDFEGRLRWVVRYMPFHGNSVYAATALEAAGEQGKYWEALDLLLERQPEWGSHHSPKPELIPEILATLGLDQEQFKKDLKSNELKNRVLRDQADGQALGVNATPSFFVNGRPLSQLGYGPLRELIVSEMDAKL